MRGASLDLRRLAASPLANHSLLRLLVQGPFVHVAVAVSDSLMRLHCFRHCRRNISKRLEILGCASAAGVASTFGTPFGGVLFSIEVRARAETTARPHHTHALSLMTPFHCFACFFLFL